MAVLKMKEIKDSRTGRVVATAKALECQDKLVAAVNGNTILLPAGFSGASVTLSFPVAGSAKVQLTSSPQALVEEESASVAWVDWPHGVVSSIKQDVIMGKATAVRQVNVSGESVLDVRA